VRQIKDLHVDSAPVLHDGRLDAVAVLQDPSGEIVDLTSLVSGIDLFTGFDGVTGIGNRSRYQQTAFRLWKVTGTTFPSAKNANELVWFDQRGAALADEADDVLGNWAYSESAAGQSIIINFQFPSISGASYGGRLSYFAESDLFVSEEPLLIVNGSGVLQDTCEIHTSYHVQDTAGKLLRDRETRAVNVGGIDLIVVVPWVRPFASDLHDKNTGSDAWPALHSDVADAMETKYSANRQYASVQKGIHANGSGQVGAVLY
jgi:hypothetical protein